MPAASLTEGATDVSDQANVGPVLESGTVGRAVVAAISKRHPEATIQDRGSYVRVLVAGRCVLAREDVERELGHPFQLPRDLEHVMPAFQGRLRMNEHEAIWE
jgi:hypothetical protein